MSLDPLRREHTVHALWRWVHETLPPELLTSLHPLLFYNRFSQLPIDLISHVAQWLMIGECATSAQINKHWSEGIMRPASWRCKSRGFFGPSSDDDQQVTHNMGLRFIANISIWNLEHMDELNLRLLCQHFQSVRVLSVDGKSTSQRWDAITLLTSRLSHLILRTDIHPLSIPNLVYLDLDYPCCLYDGESRSEHVANTISLIKSCESNLITLSLPGFPPLIKYCLYLKRSPRY